MAKIKILLADDHQLFLDGILSLLKVEKNLDVAATATDGIQVLELLKKEKFDVCILDINMPKLNGIETAKAIKEKKYSAKIIILTTYNDKEFISELLLADVAGYVLKNTTKTELVKAINNITDGGKYFSNEVQDSIMNNYLDEIKKEKKKQDREEETLTPREIEITKLLAKEHTNEMIAGILFISYRTVETHRKNIMHKTRAKNLAGLIRYAIEKKIIS